eukprot:PhM_4_TR15114/c0_g1_i2/m.78916
MLRRVTRLHRSFISRQHYGIKTSLPDAVVDDNFANTYLNIIWYVCSADNFTRPEADYARGVAEVWFEGATRTTDKMADRAEVIAPTDEDYALIRSYKNGVFTTRRLVYDAIMTCHADGFYAPSEQERIKEVAGKLGVDAATLERMEGIAKLDESLRLKKVDILRSVP